MNSSERRLEIYKKLLEEEYLDVNELASLFNVSAMTIRRDLAIYEKQGILTTAYGGAYLNQDALVQDAPSPLQSRLDVSTRKMGEVASALLRNGQSIFLDANMNTLGIVYGLKDLKLTVVTNSLDAANILRTFPKIKLIIAPGTYNNELSGLVSSVTISFLRQFSFDAAILGGTSMDIAYGLTVDDETDAHLKATAADCAKQNIVMLNSTNIGESSFAQAIPLRKINYLVTDSNISDESRTAFEHRGVQVIVGL